MEVVFFMYLQVRNACKHRSKTDSWVLPMLERTFSIMITVNTEMFVFHVEDAVLYVLYMNTP